MALSSRFFSPILYSRNCMIQYDDGRKEGGTCKESSSGVRSKERGPTS